MDLIESRPPVPADWREEARRGGYPTPAVELEGDDARSLWFDGYLRTYLERDLQTMAAIDNLVDFRRLMRAASLRLGAMVNQTELGRDTRVPRATVQRYLDLLETSFQIARLAPYSVNRTKRLIKTPKLYWSDPGLALWLSGSGAVSGAHLETLVLVDLLVWRDSRVPAPEVLYWRTTTDLEVDFVIETGGPVAAHRGQGSGKPRLLRHEELAHLPGGVSGSVHRRAAASRRCGDAVDVGPNPCRSLVAGGVAPDVRPLTWRGCPRTDGACSNHPSLFEVATHRIARILVLWAEGANR